jgi:hypothetical protein
LINSFEKGGDISGGDGGEDLIIQVLYDKPFAKLYIIVEL